MIKQHKKHHWIAVANQKGGVGKTTTTINLATALAAVGKRVLIIDLDPQGNASSGLGIELKQRHISSYEVLIHQSTLLGAVQKTLIPNLFIVPANIHLVGAELELVSMLQREMQLKSQLEDFREHWDYCLMDCPPSLGLLTINALTAATSVLIPLQCEFFALEGLSHLLRTIDLVKKKLNPSLSVEGVVLTMFDKRNNLTTAVEQDVRQYLKDKVYQTTIPRNVKVSEAPSHGKPVLVYDLKCPGAKAYMALAREILERQGFFKTSHTQEQAA